MKTAAEAANHPMAKLQQELVTLLRAGGSIEGAESVWLRLRSNRNLWPRIVHYGLRVRERQIKLTKVAFPDCNFFEVDAAIAAGNKLHQLFELACGRAFAARDSLGHYKLGRRGLLIARQALPKR